MIVDKKLYAMTNRELNREENRELKSRGDKFVKDRWDDGKPITTDEYDKRVKVLFKEYVSDVCRICAKYLALKSEKRILKNFERKNK